MSYSPCLRKPRTASREFIVNTKKVSFLNPDIICSYIYNIIEQYLLQPDHTGHESMMS